MQNNQAHGFAPIRNAQSKILVLGSMPGAKSLAAGQYYAHPRNAFWWIMASLFQMDVPETYELKVQMLKDHGVALWDVMASCKRRGSLDSAIEPASVTVNDFNGFFRQHAIGALFFNGRSVERFFKRFALPQTDPRWLPEEHICLPSTSPANARLNPDQKLAQWRVLLEYLG